MTPRERLADRCLRLLHRDPSSPLDGLALDELHAEKELARAEEECHGGRMERARSEAGRQRRVAAEAALRALSGRVRELAARGLRELVPGSRVAANGIRGSLLVLPDGREVPVLLRSPHAGAGHALELSTESIRLLADRAVGARALGFLERRADCLEDAPELVAWCRRFPEGHRIRARGEALELTLSDPGMARGTEGLMEEIRGYAAESRRMAAELARGEL